MIAKVISYLKKRLPPSSRAFERGVRDIMAVAQDGREDSRTALAQLQGENRVARERIDALTQECASGFRELERGQQVHGKAIADLTIAVDKLQQSAGRQGRSIEETLWAEVFNNTISSSEWLQDSAFSPGRWSVGYAYLYVLYRVLNEVRPTHVLDLGLGQSTRMIAQYAAAHEGVQHIVIEHDEKWVDFFSRNYRLPDSTRMLKLDWDYVSFKDADRVRVYSGFAPALRDSQFNLISIDGPLGGDMKQFARIDVLGLLPGRLASSFVIMLDDYERVGESRTFREMQDVLSEAGVEYSSGWYSGGKDLGLLCSPDLAFLCSM